MALAASSNIYSQNKFSYSTGFNFSTTNVDFHRQDITAWQIELIENGTRWTAIMPYFGIGRKYEIMDKLSAFVELQMSIKGHKEKGTTYLPDTVRYNRNEVLVYLDFLPKLKYRFAKNFYAGFGFNGGFKFFEGEVEFLSVKSEKTRDRFDFGTVYSVSYTKNNYELRIQYNHGLSKTLKPVGYRDWEGNELGTMDEYNRNWQIGIIFHPKPEDE